jgi:hypothetical protein
MKKSGREKIARKVVKITILVVILSITCLIFVSLFPWISITENDYVKEDLYFNFQMMKKSNDDDINNLYNDINIINLSFWTLIILGFLSFLGATIHISKKIPKFGYILLSIGCANLIFSILIIYFQVVIIRKIENIDTISTAAISPFFEYYYILILFSIVVFILSAFYSKVVISHAVQNFLDLREEKKNKKVKKKTLLQKNIKPEPKLQINNEKLKEKPTGNLVNSNIVIQQATENEKITDSQLDEKHKEIEKFLDSKVNDKETPPEADKRPSLEKEESKDVDDEIDKKNLKEIKKERKDSLVFPPEKNVLKPKDTDEIKISDSFEKALSSAIEKKHAKKEKIVTEEEVNKKSKKVDQTKKTLKDKPDS